MNASSIAPRLLSWLTVMLACAGVAAAELRVQAIDRVGEPVAGARIDLLAGDVDEPVAGAETDDEGQAPFDVGEGPYRARVEADGFVATLSASATVDPSSPTTWVVSLYPGAGVAVETLGPDGQPLAEAEVCLTLRDWRGLPPSAGAASLFDDGRRCLSTDEDGRAATPVLPLGRYTVEVEASGMTSTTRVMELERDAETLTLRLKRGGRIAGRIENREEQPVAGAVVRARDRGRGTEVETTTSDEGAFVVTGLAPGHWELRIEPADGATIVRDGLEVAEGATLDLGTLRTRPGLSIDGRIVDPTGEGLADATVSARAGGRVARRLREASSTEDGRFSVAGLGEDPVHLLVEGPDGYAAAAVEDVEPRTRDLEIELLPVGRVCGWVVTADGKVPGGASVTALPRELGFIEEFQELLRSGTRELDPESGAFCLEDVHPADEVEVTGGAPGYQPRTVTVAVEPDGEPSPIELVLERGLSVEGSVVDTDGLPIVEAAVRHSARAMVFTDRRGEFRLEGLAAGMNTLQAAHRDHAMESRDVMLPLAEGERLEFVLGPGGTIEGSVRHLDGRGAEGVTIEVDRVRGAAVTDAAGHYRLEHVPAGDRTVTRSVPGRYDDFERRHVVVAEGESVTVDFVLGVVLEGRVLRAGVPVPGVPVALAQPHDATQFAGGSHAVRRTFSDEQGEYRLAGVVPGWGTVTVEEPRQVLMRPVEVPQGEEPRLDLHLPDRPLSGRVVRAADESGLAGAWVNATLSAVDGAPQSGGSSSYSSSSGGYGIRYSLTSQHQVQTHAREDGAFDLFVESMPEVKVGAFARGFDYVEVAADPSDPAPVIIALTRRVRLVVLLRDPRGQPTDSSMVCIHSGEEDSPSTSCTSGGGGQTEHTVQEGPVTIRAAARGFGAQVIERELRLEEGRDREEITFDLVPGAPLEVRLVGQSGDAAQIVSLIDPAGRERAILVEERTVDPATGDLLWSTWPLEPGSWRVTVDTGLGDTVAGEVEIAPGHPVELTLP